MRPFLITFALVAASIAAPALASTVTIGASTTGNCVPFQLCYTGQNMGYQQVYSSSDFSGLTSISMIQFYPDLVDGTPLTTISGAFVIDFSITSQPVNGLSANETSNTGVDYAQFFSGTVSNALSFSGSPYIYDPSLGNLLMTVSGTGTSPGYLAAGIASDTSRVYDTTNNGIGPDPFGLKTTFTVSPAASPTPEPSSLLLLGTGIVAVACSTRRRLFGK